MSWCCALRHQRRGRERGVFVHPLACSPHGVIHWASSVDHFVVVDGKNREVGQRGNTAHGRSRASVELATTLVVRPSTAAPGVGSEGADAQEVRVPTGHEDDPRHVFESDVIEE